jgi:hypothetical protein
LCIDPKKNENLDTAIVRYKRNGYKKIKISNHYIIHFIGRLDLLPSRGVKREKGPT